MNADSVVTLLLGAALLIAPAALAQAPQGQAEDALDRGEDLAQDTASDPARMAENATNASWQGNQANWTSSWTCATIYTLDEDAGEAAQDATGCTVPEDVQAGQNDDEENRTDPRAEAERDDDPETAARDIAAALQAYGDDVREDPEDADEHTLDLLNRTLAILERLLDPPRLALSLAHTAITELASGVVDIAALTLQTSASIVSAMLDTGEAATISLGSTTLDLVASVTSAASHAGQASIDVVQSAADAAGDAIRSLLPTSSHDETTNPQDPLEPGHPATNPDELLDDVPRITPP